jgi:preprotein translocase subunit SecA
MRIFGGERMKNLLTTIGAPEGMPIENRLISKQIEKAQQKVEGHNFDIRKHLVEYDDVINKHREAIYKKRNEILEEKREEKGENEGNGLKNIILNYIQDEIYSIVNFHTQSNMEESWNLDEIYEVMDTVFSVPLDVRINLEDIKDQKQDTRNKIQEIKNNQTSKSEIINYLYNLAVEKYIELENKINTNQNINMGMVEKSILLRSIDMLWIEHIDAMDHMRQGISLRGYGQKDPLVEYKREAHRMFQELLANIRKQVVYSIYKVGLMPIKSQQPTINSDKINFSGLAKTGAISSSITFTKAGEKIKKISRNDPCPCGKTNHQTGKPLKYKKCCGV